MIAETKEIVANELIVEPLRVMNQVGLDKLLQYFKNQGVYFSSQEIMEHSHLNASDVVEIIIEDTYIVDVANDLYTFKFKDAKSSYELTLKSSYGQTNGMAAAAHRAGIAQVLAHEGAVKIEDLPRIGEVMVREIADEPPL